MARRRLDPSQETIRLNVRAPANVRAVLIQIGGGGNGALSRGLRRLFAHRTVPQDGDDAVILDVRQFAAMCAEIERLRKETRK